MNLLQRGTNRGKPRCRFFQCPDISLKNPTVVLLLWVLFRLLTVYSRQSRRESLKVGAPQRSTVTHRLRIPHQISGEKMDLPRSKTTVQYLFSLSVVANTVYMRQNPSSSMWFWTTDCAASRISSISTFSSEIQFLVRDLWTTVAKALKENLFSLLADLCCFCIRIRWKGLQVL